MRSNPISVIYLQYCMFNSSWLKSRRLIQYKWTYTYLVCALAHGKTYFMQYFQYHNIFHGLTEKYHKYCEDFIISSLCQWLSLGQLCRSIAIDFWEFHSWNERHNTILTILKVVPQFPISTNPNHLFFAVKLLMTIQIVSKFDLKFFF